MKPTTRAVIAYIAARHVTGQGTSSIYDASQGGYVMITGSFGAEQVSIHDHQDRCQITGTRHGGRYDLHHQGNDAAIVIEFDGPQFRGVEHASGSAFHGVVEGRQITLHVGGEKFDYSL